MCHVLIWCEKFDVDDCWGLVVKSNDKYFYIIALATAHKHVYNIAIINSDKLKCKGPLFLKLALHQIGVFLNHFKRNIEELV